MSRLITGKVSSDKADKTIVVKVEMRKTHPIYRKQYTRDRKFMAHDEKNEAKEGDIVSIRESRPLSAGKRFVLSSILERAQAGFEEADAEADIPKEELEKVVPPVEPKAEVKTAKDPAQKPEPKTKDKEKT